MNKAKTRLHIEQHVYLKLAMKVTFVDVLFLPDFKTKLKTAHSAFESQNYTFQHKKDSEFK